MDILNDFYKRYGRENGIAEVDFSPASLCLYDGNRYKVGLSLSFGTTIAFRKRKDGRIVMSKTNSNLKEGINICDIERFNGEAWARRIISVIKKIPPNGEGIEMLFQNDAGNRSFDCLKLCVSKAYSKLTKTELSPMQLLKIADMPSHYISSITESRLCIFDKAIEAYKTFNPNIENKNIIIITSGRKRKQVKLPSDFYNRADERINELSGENFDKIIGTLSKNMLSYIKYPEIKVLFNEICGFCDNVLILPDLSGVAVVIPTEGIDEFLSVILARYEKKTGLTPAFYISD